MRPKRGLHPPIQAERMARLKSSPQELKREEQVCREGRHQGIHSVRTVEGPGWKVRSAGHPFGHGGGRVGERSGSWPLGVSRGDGQKQNPWGSSMEEPIRRKMWTHTSNIKCFEQIPFLCL